MASFVTRSADTSSLWLMGRCFTCCMALSLTAAAAFAQIGQPYPGGGGYPGGPYPGGYPGGYPGTTGGSGLPIPGRKGKKAVPAQATDTLTGKIRRISTTELILEPEDRRILTVAIEKNTQYATATGAAKFGDFDTGDQVSIDAARDNEGYLHALKITLEKKGETTVSSSAGPRPQVIEGDPAPADVAPSTTLAPRPVARDSDDPGPPMLKRGMPPPAPTINSSSRRERGAAASAEPVQTARAAVAVRNPQGAPSDAVIVKAREVAENFSETLPNYEVKQFTTRYETGAAQGERTQWRALDVVTADVLYEDGKEGYKNIQVNGKSTKDIEKTGSWSTGEFATVLRDVLSPSTDADFYNKRSSTVANHPAWRYDYTVEQPNSQWKIIAASDTYLPAYRGSIWIDKENARVLRIEMSSRDMPKQFPIDKTESTTEYDYVLIGDQKFLLPTHSEVLSCSTGTASCTKNVIDFRNYRKFGSKSDIKFEAQ